MDKKKVGKVGKVVGGIGLLAATAVLCMKGLQKVEEHMAAKKEAEIFEPEETVANMAEAAEEVTDEASGTVTDAEE